MDPVALDGVLVIDKPTGPTSHDIVACVRRSLGLKKVGHLGTLDPLATGVLPLVMGRATRIASLFTDASKQYDAVIRLGLITDTYDITGTVVGGSDAPAPDTASTGVGGPSLPPEAVTRAASGFVGSYTQRPPPLFGEEDCRHPRVRPGPATAAHRADASTGHRRGAHGAVD